MVNKNVVNKINRPSVALLQNIKYLSALVINKNIFFFSIHIFFFKKRKINNKALLYTCIKTV